MAVLFVVGGLFQLIGLLCFPCRAWGWHALDGVIIFVLVFSVWRAGALDCIARDLRKI
jgi:hypothetical protein